MGIITRSSSVNLPSPVRLPYSQEPFWKNTASPAKNSALESSNLFVKQDNELTAAGKLPVSWNFPTMPSEEWKNGVGSALTAYAADQTDANWDAVVTAFVDGWASEYALANG